MCRYLVLRYPPSARMRKHLRNHEIAETRLAQGCARTARVFLFNACARGETYRYPLRACALGKKMVAEVAQQVLTRRCGIPKVAQCLRPRLRNACAQGELDDRECFSTIQAAT
jgi:hypothetical protein